MEKEIERKFLVNVDGILDIFQFMPHTSYDICQYFITEDVRLRMEGHSDGSEKAYYTIKSNSSGDLFSREEVHKEVDYNTIQSFHSSLCDSNAGIGVIRKTRHVFPHDKNTNWEVDFFHGNNEGLVIAEIEVPCEDYDLKLKEFNYDAVRRWLGEEITGVEKYYNHNLAKNNYGDWKK